MASFKSLLLGLFLAMLAGPSLHSQTEAKAEGDPVLLRTLQQELDRAMTSLAKAEPAPYFISYSANEVSGGAILASNGAILGNFQRHERSVDISVRVGGRDLDN